MKSRILAIDYGLKRVGIAVTDVEKIIAIPLVTISSNELFNFLVSYCSREHVEKIVIGCAGDVDPNTDIIKATRNVFDKVKEIFKNINVELYDERYTSKIAYHMLINGGFKKKDRNPKKVLDKMSASVILQSYLDRVNLVGGV